jgi:hypothetical protein
MLSLQPGPRDAPMQGFIKRNKKNSTFFLYLGLSQGKPACSFVISYLNTMQKILTLGHVFALSLTNDATMVIIFEKKMLVDLVSEERM